MEESYQFSLTVSDPNTHLEFPLPVGITNIGREPGNELVLASPMISRRHAQLVTTLTECQINELGSVNGTRVNGEKLVPGAPVTLADGATIEITPYTIIFHRMPVSLPESKNQTVLPEAEADHDANQKQEPEQVPPVAPKVKKPEPKPTVAPEVEKPQAKPAETAILSPAVRPLEESLFPPGLSTNSLRLINYLPDIYQTDFISRLLAMFEAILLPVEWNIENFDLFLDPATAPKDFLPWLANWYEISFDASWQEEQRRLFLSEGHQIFKRRGTKWALSRALEIYTGRLPEIVEPGDGQDPFTFVVRLKLNGSPIKQELVERLIDANKPAHTSYQLFIS